MNAHVLRIVAAMLLGAGLSVPARLFGVVGLVVGAILAAAAMFAMLRAEWDRP